MNGSLSFLVITSWPRFTLLTVPSFLNHFSPLPSPPLSAASFFLFLWLCLISSSHSLFYYLPLNVGFLLTTLFYLFMKNIHPGGIPSISLIGLLLVYLMSQPKPLNFTLHCGVLQPASYYIFRNFVSQLPNPAFIINLQQNKL